MTDALERVLVGVMDGIGRCLKSKSMIVTHGIRGAKVERRDNSACSAVAT